MRHDGESVASRRGAARAYVFLQPDLFPCAPVLQGLQSPFDPIPLRSTTLMQSENMRRRWRWRRRHDPVVDHPEDASCKNKRTGSLGMSRDSVLYRSPAYIDTNLCPPQAVLCICHIYIHRFSLSRSLPLSQSPSLSCLHFPFLSPFLSRFLPFSPPPRSSLSSSRLSVRDHFLSRFLSGPASSQHAYRSSKFAPLFVLRHPRTTTANATATHRTAPCVLVVRVCGVGWDRA